MTTDFVGWHPDRINAHLDERERAVLGGLAELPVTSAPRRRSEFEWAVLAKAEGEERAAELPPGRS